MATPADMNPTDLIAKLQTREKDNEPHEVGPGDVGPTVARKGGSGLVTLAMTEAEVGLWWTRVERARQRVKSREGQWDLLLNEYMPIVTASGAAETVKVQAHFRNVHTKLGQMFYRSPDLILTPDDPSPAQNMMPNPAQQMQPPGMPPLPPLLMEDIISIKQAVMKKKLGRDGIKANRLMDELLFDVLAWAGIGVCKIGFHCSLKTVQQPVMGPDPNFQQPPGSMLGLQQPPQVPQIDPATGQPQMEPVEVSIYDDWYARRISPKKFLTNDDLRSTRIDQDATWVGFDFYISQKRSMREFGLTEAEAKAGAEDDRIHKYSEDTQTGSTLNLVHCIEIWPKASVFGPEGEDGAPLQPHPQALNQLVLIEGLKTRPAVWRPSPDQDFDESGRLTQDSLIGFPIKVLTIRDLADSCFPPSDSAHTNSDIKQMSTWRRQSIRIRDAAIGKYLYDAGAFGDEEVEQLKNGDVGEFVPVNAGAMQNGVDRVFAAVSRIQSSPDDQRGFAGIKQDMNETLGIGSNQSGVETDTVRTATEADTVANASQARNEKELGRVVDFYLDIARGIDQLLMRYMDQNEYVQVGGEEAAARMQVWNGKLITGRYLYDIAPDSQLQPDNAKDFQQMLNYFNIVAMDPMVNRAYLHRRLARMKGLDPSKVIASPEMMAMQPQHGGSGTEGGTVSQHMASNSGEKENAPGAENTRKEQVK